MINLKNKLQKKEITLGSWITIGNTSIAEIMSLAGFEWLVVDTEHFPIHVESLFNLIQVIELSGVVPLVRIGENNLYLIKQAMDSGAHGIIVPMVNTVEEAQRAVKGIKYAPEGNRGVGLTRASKYGNNFKNYKTWIRDNGIVIVQIEDIKAVNNLEAILNVDGVDAFMVGPYDLSSSLGVPGEFDNPKVLDAFSEIDRIVKKVNVSSGFHIVNPDLNDVYKKIDKGYNFIVYSTDFLLLNKICINGVSKINNYIKQK